MGQREDFVQAAIAEIGVVEKPTNKVKYNNDNGQAWCGYFVMWCAKKVGLTIPNCVYTPAGVAGFQGKGLWKNVDKPEVGGVVFFDFPGGERTDHVGIVVKIRDDGCVETVEGNTTADGKKGSQANGGEVARKVRAYKKDNKKKLPVFITGYGSPKFKTTVK